VRYMPEALRGRYAIKAVVLHEYGGPEKLKFEDNVPEPQIGGSTVLTAAGAASVNPIDWKLGSGMRQKDSPSSFPAILGRDVSGVVRAVGANVKHFKPGDRVLALSNATYAELHGRLFSDVIYGDVQPAERLFVFAKHRIKERSI
jgi:NADPH:quinone reductase-like Zn-dependent oxidoreductase